MFHLFLPPQTPTEAVTYLEHRFWLTAASGGSGLEIKNEFWNTRDNSPATAVDLAAFALQAAVDALQAAVAALQTGLDDTQQSVVDLQATVGDLQEAVDNIGGAGPKVIWSGGCTSTGSAVPVGQYARYCADAADPFSNASPSHLLVNADGTFTVQTARLYRINFWGVTDGVTGSVKVEVNGSQLQHGLHTGFFPATRDQFADVTWQFAVGDTFDPGEAGIADAAVGQRLARRFGAGGGQQPVIHRPP